MIIELTKKQVQAQQEFRTFVDEEIVPYADQYDEVEITPSETVQNLAARGYLGIVVPEQNGGQGFDTFTCGLLCEEIGRGSASLLSLITVHAMISIAILKWGTSAQRKHWLPRLARGETIGAFALTESSVGSDAKNVETSAVYSEKSYVLNGEKNWISWGQVADLFLIIAQFEGKPTAFLVERESRGFAVEPITGMLGFRSSMLARLRMNNCEIPAANLVGRVGFGFSPVATSALEYGRYFIACGCVGLAQACLEASISHASKRKQGSSYIGEYQLIQQMVADMVTNIQAARLLCYQAGYFKDTGNPHSINQMSIAKYHASKMAFKVASDAVQIHGARGCTRQYPVQRYLRDSKIMEIIEGTNQIQQIIISTNAFRTFC